MRIVSAPFPQVLMLAATTDEADWLIEGGDAGRFLSPLELAALDRMAGKRRREWALGRIAAKRLAAQHGISDPRDCVVERGRLVSVAGATLCHLSISHSGPYAAAVAGRGPVGVDVQVVRGIAERAAHLFLSEDEENDMQGCSLPDRMLHFWCAKEAAWKALGGSVPTLRRVALRLRTERERGLLFDRAETAAGEDFILAVTGPIS